MDNETLLKAELYDANKQIATLSNTVTQVAAVLGVSTLETLYAEVVRLKQLDVPKEEN